MSIKPEEVKAVKMTKQGQERKGHTVDCSYCGEDHLRGKCPTYGKTCTACSGPNHFAVQCRRGQTSSNRYSGTGKQSHRK